MYDVMGTKCMIYLQLWSILPSDDDVWAEDNDEEVVTVAGSENEKESDFNDVILINYSGLVTNICCEKVIDNSLMCVSMNVVNFPTCVSYVNTMW